MVPKGNRKERQLGSGEIESGLLLQVWPGLSVLTLASRFFFYGFPGIIPLTEENRSNFPIHPNLLSLRLQMALKFVS